MTPEKKMKAKVINILKDELDTKHLYYFYPQTGGYGKSGVPDIIGCYRGHFFGIEVKAEGKGEKTVTPLQKKNIEAIRNANGLAWVCWSETQAQGIAAILNMIHKQRG